MTDSSSAYWADEGYRHLYVLGVSLAQANIFTGVSHSPFFRSRIKELGNILTILFSSNKLTFVQCSYCSFCCVFIVAKQEIP